MRCFSSILVLLSVPLASLASLITSAEVGPGYDCPAVTQTGTSHAEVTQHCVHPPSGIEYVGGRAMASAAPGDIRATTMFANNFYYPRGSASADFTSIMHLVTEAHGPLTIDFHIRFTGVVWNHAESHANAHTSWTFNGSPLGSAGAGDESPGNFDRHLVWRAPGTLANGEDFVLSGGIYTEAADYHGYADARAVLTGFTLRDEAGLEVVGELERVPEPRTLTMVCLAVALLLTRPVRLFSPTAPDR